MKEPIILIWAINESMELMKKMCNHSLETANHLNYEPILFGIGLNFIEHKQRLELLKEYLQNVDPAILVVCMDGSDTLFNDSVSILLDKFEGMKTSILISAEKDYTYQYLQFKELFDSSFSPYRYVNAGTFMGYAGALLEMLEEIELIDKQFPEANDQGLLGIWVHNNLHNPGKVKLDLESAVFWVTTQDWYVLKEVAENSKTIINPNTNQKPVIIHNVGNQEKSFRAIYDLVFENVMRNN
ncbi:MAG: hypothetical protein ACI88Z_001965 [Sphingobacteriales bacterium]|jgi:hypothetical protein